MKKIIFSFVAVAFFSYGIYAKDSVDYDKPFDEIKAQISSFDNRHSLMPVQVDDDSSKKQNVKSADRVNDGANGANVSPVMILPEVKKSGESKGKSRKSENVKSEDFDTIIVRGRDETEDEKISGNTKQEELPRVVLKPITKKKNDVILSNVIEEDANKVVVRPLDVGKSKVGKKVDENVDDGYYIETDDENEAMAHIASYTNEKTAYDGLRILEKKYPQFDIFEPFVRYEKVDGKGWFYRLYLLGDRRELNMLCKDMKKNSDWCYVLK